MLRTDIRNIVLHLYVLQSALVWKMPYYVWRKCSLTSENLSEIQISFPPITLRFLISLQQIKTSMCSITSKILVFHCSFLEAMALPIFWRSIQVEEISPHHSTYRLWNVSHKFIHFKTVKFSRPFTVRNCEKNLKKNQVFNWTKPWMQNYNKLDLERQYSW